jgi:septum formation protein
MQVILASTSPRRTEILSNAKIKHIVIPSNAEEVIDETLSKKEVVKNLSYIKAYDIYQNHQNDLVIGADTIVVIDDKILGKPKDEQDAYRMLSLLSGKTHQVITGVTVFYNHQHYSFTSTTKVTFDALSNDEIKDYLQNENVYDKAGAYAIQGYACRFIKKIDGSYYNVVGLPIERLVTFLKGKKEIWENIK